jgi:hypothetical protein
MTNTIEQWIETIHALTQPAPVPVKIRSNENPEQLHRANRQRIRNIKKPY